MTGPFSHVSKETDKHKWLEKRRSGYPVKQVQWILGWVIEKALWIIFCNAAH